jgi:lipopolysaccharide cholinephosphotransferase
LLGGQDPVVDTTLRDLQLIEISILREFVRVCDAHGLRYFLAYGTLLGAVRHRGFIPWDDDIDVTMPRGDYRRFAEMCASDFAPGYTWLSYSTERHYPHWFGKVIRTDTTLRQAPTQALPYRHAVSIDVFPLDGLVDGVLCSLFQRAVFRLCRLRLGANVWRKQRRRRLLVRFVRFIPRQSAIALIELLFRRYPAEEARNWICVGGPYGSRRQSFPREWFGAGSNLAFEDLDLTGPDQAGAYLSRIYGDYMIPPEAEGRLGHHAVTEFTRRG